MASLPRSARIAGTGMFVPPRVVTNDELAELMNTSNEWIVQRTGIRERRHVDPGTQPSDLALAASEKALSAAGCTAADLDMILVATLSPEHYFPGTGSYLQRKLGLDRTPVLDLRGQCSGFIYGLETASALIKSGMKKRILLVGVEIHSTAVEFSDRGRDVAVIFGDGAGAVILEASDEDGGVLSVHTHAQGEFAERLWVEYPALGERPCMPQHALDEGRQYPKMDGKFVFRHAVTRLPEAIMEAMAANSLNGDDIDLFLFHQANLRINEFVGNMMGIPPEKAPFNIDRFGNCSAASIPMLLDECIRNGTLKRGQTAVMAAFGSGFTWGSAVVRY